MGEPLYKKDPQDSTDIPPKVFNSLPSEPKEESISLSSVVPEEKRQQPTTNPLPSELKEQDEATHPVISTGTVQPTASNFLASQEKGGLRSEDSLVSEGERQDEVANSVISGEGPLAKHSPTSPLSTQEVSEQPVNPIIHETNETLKNFIKLLRDFIIIILIVILIRAFFISPFRINGQSMENSFHDGEYILVDKISYLNFNTHFDDWYDKKNPSAVINTILDGLGKLPIHIGDPKRGDVVVIKPHVNDIREFYIKRIIGLPNDIISFKEGGVFIKTPESPDFIQIREVYLSAINSGNTYLPPSISTNEFRVPEDSYWVMGDNRENSADSRSCFTNACFGTESTHFISRANVVGKTFLDFGYFDLFKKNDFPKLGTLRWIHKPRFFDTPRSSDYPELDAPIQK